MEIESIRLIKSLTELNSSLLTGLQKSTIKFFFFNDDGDFGVTLATSKVLDARHRRSAD